MMDDKDHVIMELKFKIGILEEKSENMDLQMKRFVAHLESEQRVYGGHRTLIDYNKTILDVHQKLIEKHESMLLNNGKGMSFKIDRLEQKADNSKDLLRTWIMIISFLASLYAIFRPHI